MKVQKVLVIAQGLIGIALMLVILGMKIQARDSDVTGVRQDYSRVEVSLREIRLDLKDTQQKIEKLSLEVAELKAEVRQIGKRN